MKMNEGKEEEKNENWIGTIIIIVMNWNEDERKRRGEAKIYFKLYYDYYYCYWFYVKARSYKCYEENEQIYEGERKMQCKEEWETIDQ